MNKSLIHTFLLVTSSAFLVASCGEDNTSFISTSTGTSANSGIISQKNFSVLTADVAPKVIDATTGVFSKTDVEITAYVGDRNNQRLSDSHTINFAAEYGLIEPSCVTKDGSCSVTWSAIKRPAVGGPGDDGVVTITAYAIGEESFTDVNGNNLFDDADGILFDDLEEPFVDANENNIFDAGDVILDVVSTNDPSGANAAHDYADGFLNSPACIHTSLCGQAQTVSVFADVSMTLVNGTASRTIGGDVSGLTGSALTLQNNGGDDLIINLNGSYTFTTPVDDGSNYLVTIAAQPTGPSQTCTVANPTGTVSANVTNVDVTCADDFFTIGGTVNVGVGETLVIANGSDSLTITDADNGIYVFPTQVIEGTDYNVSLSSYTGVGGVGSCTLSNNSGTVATADIDDIDITCP